MHAYNLEQSLFQKSKRPLIGVDEAGRGSWAGPVVAAAVLLTHNMLKDKNKPKLMDSKKIAEKKRLHFFSEVITFFPDIAISLSDHCTIESINILQATLLSMAEAVKNLNHPKAIILVDGKNKIPAINNKQHAIIHGDSLAYSISAASIVAKVFRDKIMQTYDRIYPQYNFKQNKGYGTKEHYLNLKKYGPCSIHRKTYQPIKSLLDH